MHTADVVAKRDARLRSQIGEKRYFTKFGGTICDDRQMTQCHQNTTGYAVIEDYPDISPKELPFFVIRLANGNTAYMRAIEWDSLQTEEQRKAEQREKAECERRGGLRIGMTADQVKSSCWGKPERINQTITGAFTHEQWVYPGNNYVYLRNGTVTTIQTNK